jgi:pyruvyl transferase EpsO
LKSLLYEQLSCIIGNQCILVAVPYYQNVGDVLIWEGERQFLSDIGSHIESTYSVTTFPKGKNLSKSTNIIFSGGGNIGDIYDEYVDLLKYLTIQYPQNRIIVLPQTVYYSNPTKYESDFSIIGTHKNLYFCARDRSVYNHLLPILGKRVILIPDMAFCIDSETLSRYSSQTSKNKLYLMRTDQEKVLGKDCNQSDGDLSDWITEEKKDWTVMLNDRFWEHAGIKRKWMRYVFDRIWDIYAQSILKKRIFRKGVQQVSQYEQIETSRLHGSILAVLLNRQCILHDNCYHKNLQFYETWFTDLDIIRFAY